MSNPGDVIPINFVGDPMFHFVSHSGEYFASYCKNGVKFYPLNTDSKEKLAAQFVDILDKLYQSYNFPPKLYFNLWSGESRLYLTNDKIVCDEPNKPFDYWTLKLAQKLWKNRPRNIPTDQPKLP